MKTNKFLTYSYDTVMIGIGGLLAAVGINGFLIPCKFFDGGVTGLSMLGASLSTVPLYAFILIVNIPFLAVGWKRFGHQFIIKCLLSIVYFSLLVKFIHLPMLAHDKILCAVFGGILLGAGIGFAVNGGSVLDGTEIAAIMLCKKFGVTIGSVILAFNVVIFSFVALAHGYEIALYSVLTYIFASKSANFLIHGLEDFIGVSVVSKHSDKIRKALIDELGVGATVYDGRTGLENIKQEILFCVITRYDVQRVKTMISEIDEKAFLIMHPVDNVQGGLVKTKLRKKRF